MLNLMVSRLAMGAVKLINALHTNTSISVTLIPQARIEGMLAPYCINLTFNLVVYDTMAQRILKIS